MRIFKRKNSPNWWATWNDQKGRRHRRSTRTDDKKLAEAMAAKWMQENFMEEQFGKVPETPFVDALLRYGEEKKRENLRSYDAVTRYLLQRFLDHFGNPVLTELTPRVLQQYADLRRKTIKEATLHRELAVLQAILNKARREGYLNHVPAFPRVKLPKGRCRWLTLEEEARLLAHASDHLKAIIAFAIDTGGRRGEILSLDWRNVDLDRNRVLFTETKNGEDRSVRLTDRARGVLLSLRPTGEMAVPQGAVFTYQGKGVASVSTAFERARRRAGLEDVRFHDLRHTFASRLVQNGVPLYEVMQLTGHKSLVMVQRYAHLAPEFQERAIDALNSYRENAIGTVGHTLGTLALKSDDFGFSPNENPLVSQGVRMVEPDGIEPTTSTMPL